MRRIFTVLAVMSAITLSSSLAGAIVPGATPQQVQADMAELMLSYNAVRPTGAGAIPAIVGNDLIGNNWWQAAVALSTLEAYQLATGDARYSYAITDGFNFNKSGNFEDAYMDDTGWWGVAWLQAYRITGQTQYLQMAETEAKYIHGYWDSTCGGGIWWNTSKNYKNAITNELFLELTAGLHNALSLGDPNRATYLDWAEAEWS
jgi:predicted alpha-1,6-mannanase (GH76 family)